MHRCLPFLYLLTLISIPVGAIGQPLPALAHGTRIQHRVAQAIAIQAVYATGEPMTGAQVLVFAPGLSEQPWLTGAINSQGQFLFQPDQSRPGNWRVEVLQTGHGGRIEIPVNPQPATVSQPSIAGQAARNAPSSSPKSSPPAEVKSGQGANPANPNLSNPSPLVTPESPYSGLQKGVMLASVVWGCIGTALFFSRRPKNAPS